MIVHRSANCTGKINLLNPLDPLNLFKKKKEKRKESSTRRKNSVKKNSSHRKSAYKENLLKSVSRDPGDPRRGVRDG